MNRCTKDNRNLSLIFQSRHEKCQKRLTNNQRAKQREKKRDARQHRVIAVAKKEKKNNNKNLCDIKLPGRH